MGYINREDAINAIRVAYWDKDIQAARDDPCVVDAMTDWAIRQLKTLPSADVIKPIRCKDCKYFRGEMAAFNCSFHLSRVCPEGYCYGAERTGVKQ